MITAGIIRKLDSLGRVVILREIIKHFSIELGDPMDIFVKDETIILKKYIPRNACHVTGEVLDDNLSLYNGKLILSRKIAKEICKSISLEINKE